MTEPTSEATVHKLDDHRPATVNLNKTSSAAPLEGTVIPAAAPSETAVEPVWKRSVHTVRVVATHDRTRTTGRAVARHGMYVVGGGGIVAKRLWDGRTAARYERMMRTAEAAGQHEQALEWETRGAAFRSARHQRRMDLLQAPQRIAKGALVGAGAGLGGLLALGTVAAIAQEDISLVIAPTMAVIDLVNWLMFLAAVVWGPLVAIAPWLALLGLWGVGRARGQAPAWTMPASQQPDTTGAPITPSIVVTAIRDLGIAPLRKAIKDMEDSGAGMLGPIRIAGCGVEVDVTLPSGVSTEEVMGKRRKLAENLARHEHEVFITIPEAARTVRLWIADSGALDEPIGPSPLALDPELTADYKNGRAPWGQDLRGDAALISLYQRHLLITGLSNQGKTASLRALALWLALDTSPEFRIADLKGAGDWAMFNGLATVLIEGPTDEHVAEATEMLEEGVRELERRLLAPKGTTWKPLVLVVDEAQVAFMCPALSDDERPVDENGKPIGAQDKRPYGGTKATSRYFQAARKIHNQGRAVDVILWQGTQDPTDQNLPKLVREGAHIRSSLVVGTESQAKMALGDKAVDGGAAPHKLRQGLDKGTVVVAGDGVKLAPGQSSITIRTHYVNDEDAEAIVTRAKERRAGVTTRTGTDPEYRPDTLADIAAVLADARRMRTQQVLTGLANRDGYYREWTFPTLRAFLEGHDAAPHKSDGHMVVDAEKVARALSERDADAHSA